jgi:hypothetical protein
MAKNTGTLITAPIRPNDNLDLIASAYANEIKGGHHVYLTYSYMNNIITERREWGMLCSVYNTTTSVVETYQLSYNLNSTDISDNLNWKFILDNSSNTFKQFGNSFGATAVLGTTDNYGLQLMYNNTPALTIGTNGYISVGTISNIAPFHLYNPIDATLLIQSSINSITGSKIRLAENGYQGGYLHYDGQSNLLNIGVHINDDTLNTSDIPVITINRTNGKVGVNGYLTVGSVANITPFHLYDPIDATLLIQSQINSRTGSKIRLAENGYQGAYLHYDGQNNALNIGMHITDDILDTSDINAITINRGTGNIGINNATIIHIYNCA